MSSFDRTSTTKTNKPSLWDKLTGNTSSSSSSYSSSSSSSFDNSLSGSRDNDVVARETTLKQTTLEQPSNSNFNNNTNTGFGNSGGQIQYCQDHISRRDLAATCTKCITTTGPMQTTSGYSVASLNQPAQVHFVGEQKGSATLQSESAPLQVEVPGQTISTTLPAKRVIVEVPERQVQVSIPGRAIQLENAPEVQITTRPIIKSVEAQLKQQQLKEGLSNLSAQSAQSRSGITSSTGGADDVEYNSRTIQNA